MIILSINNDAYLLSDNESWSLYSLVNSVRRDFSICLKRCSDKCSYVFDFAFQTKAQADSVIAVMLKNLSSGYNSILEVENNRELIIKNLH